MLDIIFIGAMVAFFSIALAYLSGCDSLRKGANDQ